ncbi:MAG: glycosyltransferase [Bacteroidetes bacterium]|nr:glycosyltransferase [Bacteroidota bacterium]
MPEISVLMTAYNSERFIKEAIDSILNQTFSDFEFIIVDDGSTDQTARIVESYNDQRIRFFRCEHLGRTNALNYALKQVATPLVAFMDSDDISFPTRLEEQYKFLEKHPEIGLVSAWHYRVTETGKIKRLVRLPVNDNEIRARIYRYSPVTFPCCMVRKTFIDAIGEFNQSLYVGIDYEFISRLLRVTKFANLPKPLLYYRQHSNALTKNMKEEDFVRIYNFLSEHLNYEFQEETIQKHNPDYLFKKGLLEFYYGSVSKSRKYFIDAFLCGKPNMNDFYYIVLSLPGDIIIHFLRRCIDMSRRFILRVFWKTNP